MGGVIASDKLCAAMSKLADDAWAITQAVESLPVHERYSPRVVASVTHLHSVVSAVFQIVWGAAEASPLLKFWEINLPEVTPSLNQVMRMHPMVHKKHGQDWQDLLTETNLKQTDRITHAKGIRTVQITRNGSKLLDMDNLPGGFKHILDAIKKIHWIVDDSPDKTILISRQRKVAKGESPSTTVKVWDGVPEGAAASLLL